MIELLISLFSTAGSAGFGSILKLVAGFFQSRHEAKLAMQAAAAKESKNFQAIFSQDGMTAASAMTRRILGIILIFCGSIIAGYCVYHSNQSFTTFVLPEHKSGWKFLFGLIHFPASKEIKVSLTLGHLALMYMNLVALAVGFYFTPAGRR